MSFNELENEIVGINRNLNTMGNNIITGLNNVAWIFSQTATRMNEVAARGKR